MFGWLIGAYAGLIFICVQGNFFTNFDASAFAPPECPSTSPPSAVRGLHALVEVINSREGKVDLMWAAPLTDFDCGSDVYSVEVAEKSSRNGGEQFELVPFTGFSVVSGSVFVCLCEKFARGFCFCKDHFLRPSFGSCRCHN